MSLDFKRITLGNLLSMTTILGVAFVLYGDIQVMKNDITWIKQVLSDKTRHIASIDK